VPADAVAALHCPLALLEPSNGGEHLPVSVGVGGVAAAVQHSFAFVDHLDGH